MSVRIRPYRRGGWEVDIRLMMPDGTRVRDRCKAPVTSRSGARRWGEARERELLFGIQRRADVPTLSAFTSRFLDGYAKANRQKPSGIAAKETILRLHLVPHLGRKRLDQIRNEEVQRLKHHLNEKSSKTVNNVLTVLNTLLKTAVEWDVIDRMPCTIRLLPVPIREADFLDFEEFDRLIDAAQRIEPTTHLIVLLGGHAGLRCGEIMALEWTDVDLKRGSITVRHSEWKGHVTVPKGGRPRTVPCTSQLKNALAAHRHLRGARVLLQPNGEPLTQKIVRNRALAAARLAGLSKAGVHILRHTFCSHLAMKGAPARAIQELAGHKDLSTTVRYMHLSPTTIESAVKLLERPARWSTETEEPTSNRGDGLETGPDPKVNSLD